MDNRITTVLFDFDGTLLDTNELIIQTFQHVLNNHFPNRFSREDIYPFIGPTLMETFHSIDPDKAVQLIQEYREWNIANHDALITEYEGVIETLTALKQQGIKLSIVSTKRNDMIHRGLNVMGAAHLFDEVIGLDDVTNPKPDPEPILLALQRLKSKPEEALMVGDNFHDIEGGKNAGVRTAGVAWSLKGEAFLQTFQPDYMLKRMSDVCDIVNGTYS